MKIDFDCKSTMHASAPTGDNMQSNIPPSFAQYVMNACSKIGMGNARHARLHGTPNVNYEFRRVQHRIQTTNPPGRTITVNRNGEPRA
jgi:hypothetical protein